jgi:hypothetical protein
MEQVCLGPGDLVGNLELLQNVGDGRVSWPTQDGGLFRQSPDIFFLNCDLRHIWCFKAWFILCCKFWWEAVEPTERLKMPLRASVPATTGIQRGNND